MESLNQINEVVIDGELANVRIDEETEPDPQPLPQIFSHEEVKQESAAEAGSPEMVYKHDPELDPEEDPRSSSRRSWFGGKFPKGKKGDDKTRDDSEKNVTHDSDEIESAVGSDAGRSEVGKMFSNFGASLLNVCTLGFLQSSSSAQTSDTPCDPSKIVRELKLIEEDMVDSERGQYMRDYKEETPDRDRALATTYSEHSDSDSGSGSKSLLVSRMAKNKKIETIITYSLGSVIFLAMLAFFIVGVLFWTRNGW